MNFAPGCLVKVRERDWVVQPSDDPELLLLKPLGASDDEITGIFLPLLLPSDRPVSTRFPLPEPADLGNLQSARLLHDAARLSFRNGAGPFRSLAKLSFRPRAYQMVPLVMALGLDPVRLLIADDVGVGKTIEALLILRELIERRIIRRFAVICLPHLCDQWADEIRNKLDLEAAVIRSSTQARLDREIQGDTSVYQHYPYQVISIDYIKQEGRRDTFISQCPELVIVDEVHACACPAGAPVSQQQRHRLLHSIAARNNQHLLMLTATPHSGKPEEFQSLIGLLHPDLGTIDFSGTVPDSRRRRIAAHFIQRRRADVAQWASEKTIFPERQPSEIRYEMTSAQGRLFDEILDFARNLVSADSTGRRRRVSYWTALALLRGVASSPAAGAAMLRGRLERIAGDDFAADTIPTQYTDHEHLSRGTGVPPVENKQDSPAQNPASSQPPASNPEPDPESDIAALAASVHDADPSLDIASESDSSPTGLMAANTWSAQQKRRLGELAAALEAMAGPARDAKLAAAGRIIADNLEHGFHTVVFCRYIATARYVGEHLATMLRKTRAKIQVETVTSEDPDELRRERIEALSLDQPRVLVATDCLSEGINLQERFTAVLHYDLPWNPNRLEQREGRVDRFGQTAPAVRTALLHGKNPIDGIVLDVILRKIREIRKAMQIAIPFPEDSRGIMDSIAQAVLFSPSRAGKRDINQLMLDLEELDETREIKLKVSQKIEEAGRRESLSRSIFAHHAIRADALEKDLREADEFIGNPEAVREFVSHALAVLGVELAETKKAYRLHTANLPAALRQLLPARNILPVSFESPTPEGCYYLGRNHPFVEQLCHLVMRNTLERDHRHGAARAAVIRSADVSETTTVYLCRCRNVIARPGDGARIVAEEMLLWGYAGYFKDGQWLDHAAAKTLLERARATANMTPQAAASALEGEIREILPQLGEHMDRIARQRAEILVEAHHRFSRLLKERTRCQVVEPVLPMDILGVYIVLPEVKA